MTPAQLNTLRNAYASAHKSPYSSFYREWYAASGHAASATFPEDHAAWCTLPFLTKEHLVSTPFFKRLFVPWRDAHSVRVSSGTSGRGIVLIPRNFHIDRSYFKEKFSRMLCFYVPHFGMDEACEPHRLGHIGAIPDDLPATARMATLFHIDALAGACSPILTFLPHMSRTYDSARIRYIHLWGERPSAVQFQELKQHCPHAEISWEYSNIESGGQSGRSCPELETLEDDRVHPLTDRYYWELIEPETGTIITDLNSEGEIVLTTLWDGNAIPAIRYRTGDLAKRVKKTCSCKAAEVFQILGRVQYDRAVIPGGELKSEELERVLASFAGRIAGDFEMHIHYAPHELPRLVLQVTCRLPISHEELSAHVSQNLRIATARTLETSVRDGLLQPLVCEEKPPSNQKVRRIVRHNAV